jgi:hypothetical protein
MFIGIMGRSWARRCWRTRGWTRTRYSLSIRTQGSSCRHRAIMRIVHQDGRVPITVIALGTPADCRSVRDRERATRTNRGGYRTAPRGAEGRPERADLYSMRRWRPPSERRKYSAFCFRAGDGARQGMLTLSSGRGRPAVACRRLGWAARGRLHSFCSAGMPGWPGSPASLPAGGSCWVREGWHVPIRWVNVQAGAGAGFQKAGNTGHAPQARS